MTGCAATDRKGKPCERDATGHAIWWQDGEIIGATPLCDKHQIQDWKDQEDA